MVEIQSLLRGLFSAPNCLTLSYISPLLLFPCREDITTSGEMLFLGRDLLIFFRRWLSIAGPIFRRIIRKRLPLP